MITKARKFRGKIESAKILKEFADRIERGMKKGKKKEEKETGSGDEEKTEL